jgi:hypothetical protein
MNKKVLIFGGIILLAGVLLFFAGNIMYENDYDKYQYYLINGNTEMADIYEPIIAIDDGLTIIGVLLVIISFPIMIIGLLFIKDKDKNKQTEKKKILPKLW